MMNKLSIKNLTVKIQGKEVLRDVSLEIKAGEVHVLMGPNGAGKTSLAMAVAGHLGYRVKGKGLRIELNKRDLLALKPEERARQGLFVTFQNPVEIPGVSVFSFLRAAFKALHPFDKISLTDFKKQVIKTLLQVGLEETFLGRPLNENFSGGERKKLEVVHLLVLKPKFAILDEIDSGLDVDAVKIIIKAIKNLARKTNVGILLVTHYPKILQIFKPDKVHLLIGGEIKTSGGIEILKKIEKYGYAKNS